MRTTRPLSAFFGGLLRRARCVLLLGLILIFPLILPAQEMYEGNQNLPPFGGFAGSDFDIVALQNGNLHLHVPLGSWKQRGGGTVSAFFAYDTPAWIRQTTNITVNGQKAFLTVIDPNDGGWGFFNSAGNWEVSSPQTSTLCGSTSVSTLLSNGWVVTDPENQKHPLAIQTDTKGCMTNITKGPTTDGSGMMVDIGSATPTLTLKDGTQIPLTQGQGNPSLFTGLGLFEDPNGNQINMSTTADTLNRIPVTVSPGNGFTSYFVKDSNGTQQVYRIDWTTMSTTTNFCSGVPHIAPSRCVENGGPFQVPGKLTLPTGAFYSFVWNNGSPGELASVTLPTGATISYTYTSGCQKGPLLGIYNSTTVPNDCRAFVQSRTVTLNGVASTWTYSISTGTGGNAIVTDPLGNDEVHVFTHPTINNIQSPGSVETQVMSYQGSSTSGTLLKTVATDYTGEQGAVDQMLVNLRPTRVTTTLDNGFVTKTETDYETFSMNGTFTRLNPTEVREYAYGSGAPGALLRRTDYTYLHNQNSTYANLNIVNRPVSVTVYSGSATQVSQTTFEYDVYSHTGLPGMGSSGAVQHDSVRGTNYTTRGNTTAVSHWLNTSGTSLTTYNQYDDAGNVIASKDPNGNVTSIDYTDSWATAACAPTGPGKAFPTTITDALGHLQKMTYNSCTGTLASSKNQNDINAGGLGTVLSYDLLGRAALVSNPDGGSTTNCYSDVGGSICSQSGPPFSVVTSKPIVSGASPVTLTATKLTDGLGRVSQTQLNSDPDGPTYTAVTYDSLGRASQNYNPTRCNPPTTQCTQGPAPANIPETTWGYSTTAYDALGRVKTVTAQDGSITTSAYSGNCATVTDQAGKSRKSCSDALGRLTDVWEDPAGLNYHTTYTYDALGNLLTVVQNGSRNRTFVYDSLSRLTSATNPESGTVTYAYDANGNLTSKTSPAPNQTGSSTIAVSYCYDSLNRLTSKAYTAQSCPMASPVAAYFYDQTTYNGLTITNGVGRRTGMTDQAGAEAWSYDSMGRVLFEKRTTNSVSKTIPYTYNLDGSLASVATPTFTDGSHPWTFNYTLGGAGRPLAMNTLIVNAKYTPAGQLCNSLGQWNGNWTSVRSFNNRLQPTFLYTIRQTAGSPPAPPPCAVSTVLTNNPYQNNALALTYSYNDTSNHNNGNVQSVTNNLASWRSQSFSYDSLNRLTLAQTTGTQATNPTDCWGESYTYDAWGNLLSDQPNPSTQSAYAGCTSEPAFSTTANTKNQIALLTYDAAGNTTTCQSYMGGAATCTYDAENHLTQFSWAGGSNTYTYDGDGKRVMKSGSPGTIYWYGAGSETLIETDLSNNVQAGYAYFNGQRALRILPNNEVGFYFTDHLGNTRYFQSLAGDNVSDFYPFGGERFYSGGAPTHYKFTGKERDSESGLDYFGARYDSSSMGRFMSPDPLAGHTEDPQTLNRYSYVRNNPLNLTDPTGLDFHLRCGDDSDTCQNHQLGSYATNNDGSRGAFNATVVTSDSIRGGQNSASVDQNGVEVTTGGKSYSGEYFDNAASHTTDANGNDVNHNPVDLKGSGSFSGFSFNINGNCSGTCLASGSFSFQAARDATGQILEQRGSFRSVVDRRIPGWGKSLDEWEFHPGTEQYRFGTGPSPHFSLPDNPKNSVPTVGPFHVDKDAPGPQHLGCAWFGVGCN